VVGLAARPQALPMPAAALVLYKQTGGPGSDMSDLAPAPACCWPPQAALRPWLAPAGALSLYKPQARGRACGQHAAGASYASCRSGSIYINVAGTARADSRRASGVGLLAAPARRQAARRASHASCRSGSIYVRRACAQAGRHNAANEYLGLIERAENGAPRACTPNWTAPSAKWPVGEPGGRGRGGGPCVDRQTAYCCRTPGDHRAPLQPRRAARRYLRIRGTARAFTEPTPGGPGPGCAPRPQVLPMAAPAWLYM
jgi:hypothetical protein